MMLSNTFRASANRILKKLYCSPPKLLNCSCQRCDAIPVPQGEEVEAYCPGVSVVKGKVIDLDDDWNSSEEAAVLKKETIFHKVFLMIKFFKPSSFYSAGGKAVQPNCL